MYRYLKKFKKHSIRNFRQERWKSKSLQLNIKGQNISGLNESGKTSRIKSSLEVGFHRKKLTQKVKVQGGTIFLILSLQKEWMNLPM